MIVLGINSVYHELAAALVIDGEIVAAVEEERFNRQKHGKVARVDNPHQLPVRSIDFCLKRCGIKPQEIDAVAYSFSTQLRRRRFCLDKLSQRGDWGDPEGERVFISCLEKVPESLANLLDEDVVDRFHWVPHHIAHAASSYYPSGTGSAAILVVDGIGEMTTTMMGAGEGPKIRWLKDLEYPDSLGFLWEKLSKFLGFSEYDACKVMGLARYGSPATLEHAFQSFVHVNHGFKINPEIVEFRLDDFSRLEQSLGPRRHRNDALEQRHADVAASLQEYTDRIVLALVNDLYDLYPAETLCFAGGVALNCSSNWLLKEKGPFRNLYIPPAPHDAGTAAGAALFSYWSRNQDKWKESQPVKNAFLGPEFGSEAILEAIRMEGLEEEWCDDVAGEMATLISKGKIVGWFQDRMEFGPRALGNRSLLADPRDPSMRDTINRKVKHREDFRPFSPSVLEEDCTEWFEMGRDSASYAYMLFACPARKEKAHLIPAVLHVDGTARLQLVSKRENRKYHELISRFKGITGVPLVLNTSFNDSEPIVCSPRDAIATFKGTNIDVLVLGNYVIRRDLQDLDHAGTGTKV
jgi:carbamoyltransferase